MRSVRKGRVAIATDTCGGRSGSLVIAGQAIFLRNVGISFGLVRGRAIAAAAYREVSPAFPLEGCLAPAGKVVPGHSYCTESRK